MFLSSQGFCHVKPQEQFAVNSFTFAEFECLIPARSKIVISTCRVPLSKNYLKIFQ